MKLEEIRTMDDLDFYIDQEGEFVGFTGFTKDVRIDGTEELVVRFIVKNERILR